MRKFAASLNNNRNLAAGIVLAATSSAMAIGPEVIYTKIPTHPSSIIPGALDSGGSPVVTNFRALEDLYMNNDGSRWIITARTQQGADNEVILLIGSGLGGTMLLQEGQPVPDGVAGELIDFFASGRFKFDDANRCAFTVRARGGSSTIFQKVMVYAGGLTPTGSDFHIVGQGGNTPASGSLYTGCADVAPNPVGDERMGNSIGSIHMLNNGVIGAQDGTILNISTTRRPAIFYSNAFSNFGAEVTFNKFKQVGVDTFLNLDGSINHTYDTSSGGLSSNSFYTTPDGAHWLVHGEILGAATTADAVLIYDGQARVQEDVAIPGSGAVVNSIVNTELLANGDYFSRGTRKVAPGGAQNGVWAVRNGVLFAQTGDPVVSPLVGPAENWVSFLAFTGNTNGDIVLVGKTDNANTAVDDVVVLNGEVVLREGDPIDLNNNGRYDDDVFIGRGVNTNAAFEVEDAVLTNDGLLYIFANLRDDPVTGADLNSNPAFGASQSFLRLGPFCEGDADGNGWVNIDDLVIVITSWDDVGGPGDVNGDDIVNIDDLVIVIINWDCGGPKKK